MSGEQKPLMTPARRAAREILARDVDTAATAKVSAAYLERLGSEKKLFFTRAELEILTALRVLYGDPPLPGGDTPKFGDEVEEARRG